MRGNVNQQSFWLENHAFVLIMIPLSQFNERFNACKDSILQGFAMTYGENGEKTATLTVYARDWQSSQVDWVTLVIKISNVKAFKFADYFQQTHHIISNGIHLTEINHQIICEFGDLADMPIALDDLQFSNAFVIGKDVQILSKKT